MGPPERIAKGRMRGQRKKPHAGAPFCPRHGRTGAIGAAGQGLGVPELPSAWGPQSARRPARRGRDGVWQGGLEGPAIFLLEVFL